MGGRDCELRLGARVCVFVVGLLRLFCSQVWYDLGTLYESCSQIADAVDAYQVSTTAFYSEYPEHTEYPQHPEYRTPPDLFWACCAARVAACVPAPVSRIVSCATAASSAAGPRWFRLCVWTLRGGQP